MYKKTRATKKKRGRKEQGAGVASSGASAFHDYRALPCPCVSVSKRRKRKRIDKLNIRGRATLKRHRPPRPKAAAGILSVSFSLLSPSHSLSVRAGSARNTCAGGRRCFIRLLLDERAEEEGEGEEERVRKRKEIEPIS